MPPRNTPAGKSARARPKGTVGNARMPTAAYVASVNALADVIIAPTTTFTKVARGNVAVVHRKKK